jgi:hypothetical protein
MTAAFQTRLMKLMLILLVGVILFATLQTQLSVNAVYPCNGTWTGTLGPGSGTVSVLGSNHQISTSSIVTGSFNGDTTHGNWVGTLSTNYTVPDMGTKGQVSTTVTGTYVMSIDASGTVTGTSTIPLSGGFSGQIQISLQGTEAQTGQLTGTWTGTMNVTQVTYNGLPLGANIAAPGSGQFMGTEQRTAAQTVTSTSPSIATTTGVVVASTTMAPESSTASAQMVSVSPQNATQSAGQSGSSTLTYVAVAVVVIILIVAAIALSMRRPKKPAG